MSTLWRLLHLKGYRPLDVALHALRVVIIFGIIMFSFVTVNEYKKQAAGKCPQYEQVSEPVYKLKQ